jgi:Rod binding domain-containing protein
MQVQQTAGASQAVGASGKSQENNSKLKAECQQFEAVFWNQVLDAMQATVPADGVLGDSFANDVYQGMLNEQYSTLIAGQDSSSTGLSGIMYRQLAGQSGAAAKQNTTGTAKTSDGLT